MSPAACAGLQWRGRASDSDLLGVFAPTATALTLVALDVLEGPAPQYIGLVAAAPLLASAVTTPVRTAFVGASVLAAAFLAGYLQSPAPAILAAGTPPQQLRLLAIAVAALAAVLVSAQRVRRARLVRRLALVAAAAQEAIVRPLPPVVGSVRCAATYVSATRQATIGGDLVEVLDTRFGVRMLVGDVRGKGTGALRLAGAVLGSFREHAWSSADLSTLAGTLDAAVCREAGLEDFVTAALVEVHDDGTVVIVSCGHPAPYLVGGEGGRPAREVDVRPSPPLGLMGCLPERTTTVLRPGERLVLVTDGLLEARRPRRWLDSRSGQFLPAPQVLGQALGTGPLEPALEDVVRAVRRWSRGRLTDDMAVLVIEHRGPASRVPHPRRSTDCFFDVDALPLPESA